MRGSSPRKATLLRGNVDAPKRHYRSFPGQPSNQP